MNCLQILRLSKIKYNSITKVTSAKYISQHNFRYMDVQNKWREKDGISLRWNLIYKAPMENILNFTSAYLTASTITIGAGGIYYAAFEFNIKKMYDPVLLGGEVVIANNAFEFLIYIGAFVFFHAAVKVLLSKYVIRLYQDGDKYLAIFRGNWYNTTVKHSFNLDEVKKLKPTFVVSWGDSRFSLGKKHGILLENYFKTPEYFNYLVYKKKPTSTSDN